MSSRAPARLRGDGTRAQGEIVTTVTETTQVYTVFIKATPEAIWDALTNPDQTDRYGYRGRVEYDLRDGGSYKALANAEMLAHGNSRGDGRGRGHRGEPAAQARADLASALRRGDDRRARQPHDLGDRGRRLRRPEGHPDARPRGRAAGRLHRRRLGSGPGRRLGIRPQRPQVAAGDRLVDSWASDALPGEGSP